MLENIVIALLSLISGGLINFFYVKEKNRAQRIENDSKIVVQWQLLYDKIIIENNDLKKQVEEYRHETLELQIIVEKLRKQLNGE